MSLDSGLAFTVTTCDTSAEQPPEPLPKVHQIVVVPADTPVRVMMPSLSITVATAVLSLLHDCKLVELFVKRVSDPEHTVN